MAVSADIDFYIDSATRYFSEARRLEPSLAAVGMAALGQECLKRAKQLYEEKIEQQPTPASSGSDSSITPRPLIEMVPGKQAMDICS